MSNINGLPKFLQEAVLYVGDNLNSKWNANESEFEDFDSPDYWGMPKRVSDRLGPDDVDAIQGALSYEKYRRADMAAKRQRAATGSSLFIQAAATDIARYRGIPVAVSSPKAKGIKR